MKQKVKSPSVAGVSHQHSWKVARPDSRTGTNLSIGPKKHIHTLQEALKSDLFLNIASVSYLYLNYLIFKRGTRFHLHALSIIEPHEYRFLEQC